MILGPRYFYDGKSDRSKLEVCWVVEGPMLSLYRDDFYFVDWVHSDLCTAGCEVHTNFANKSACLTADNVQNEVVTIHRSQEVLKMLSLYT
jgi:hypothetical protein